MSLNLRYRTVVLAVWLTALTPVTVTAADFPARLDWQRNVELSTPVSGLIVKVPVRAGQQVAKGDLLVELDQRLFRARLQRVEAQLRRSAANRDEALREYERTQELYDRTLLSEHDRQVAEIAKVTAEADYATAEAAVTEARVKLEYSRVKAPFDALVTQVHVVPAQTLVTRLQATPLVTLVPAGVMRATAVLSAEELPAVAIGASARVNAGGGEYAGSVSAIAPTTSVAGESPGYRLEVEFALPADVGLMPWQSAEIQL